MRLPIFLSYLSLAVAFSSLDPEDDPRTPRTPRIRAQLMLPINPYVPNVKFTLCNTPEEQEQSTLLITELMTKDVAAARVESFNIKYFCFMDDGRECRCGDLLGPFVKLIDRGGGLPKGLEVCQVGIMSHWHSQPEVLISRVRWSSTLAVHPPLLTSLEEYFPNLKLHLEMQWSDPSTLQSSPLIHSLHVYFEPHKLNTVKTSPLLTHVQTQIMESPNLAELTVKIGSLGCVIYDVDPKFARLKGKRFPPLERLTLEAFPLTIENVDYWMENMDWSQMGDLDFRAINDPTYFFNESMKLADGLPRLEALRMELPWFRETRNHQEFEDTFRRFLGVPRDTGLSEIALEGDYQSYLQTILDGHGTTLKKLRLHDPERPQEPQREMLSEPGLSDLGRRAPNLEEISIDINHTLNGSLPVGFVDALLSETAFPSLKTIELFGMLGVSDQHTLLFKLSSRASIKRVRIHVGENRRLGGGYPADWELWEEDNRELWVAERDASGKMVVKVSRG